MSKEMLFSLTKKDFIVEPFRSSGPGGQKKNKTLSSVRIKHLASGAVAIATESRSFHQNRAKAFERLVETPEFKKWHRIEVAKRLGTLVDIDEEVEEEMKVENLKVEVFNEEKNRWEIKENKKREFRVLSKKGD